MNRLDWLTQDLYDEVDGLTGDEIFKKYDNTPIVIAELPEKAAVIFNYPQDKNIYSGKAYFLDHMVNHHEEVDISEYKNLQDDLINFDKVYADPKNQSIVFERNKENKKYSIIIKEDLQGHLLFYKSYHYGTKTKKRFVEIDLEKLEKKMSVEGGNTSINHPDLSGFGRLLSALTDKEENPITEHGSSPNATIIEPEKNVNSENEDFELNLTLADAKEISALQDKTLLHVQDAEKTIADWNMTSDDYKNYQALNDVRKRFDSKIIADFEESEDYEITERLNNFEEIKSFVSEETVEKIKEHFKDFDNPNPAENTCYANIIYNSKTKTCHAEIHDEDMMIEDVNGAELKFDKEIIEKCEKSLKEYKMNIQKEKPVIENLELLDYERYVNSHRPPMVKSFDSDQIEALKSYNEQAGDIMLYDKENDKLYRLYESDKNGFENTKDTDLLHSSSLDDMLRFAAAEASDGNMGRNEKDPMFEVNEEAGKFFSAKLEEFEVANIADNFVQSMTGSTKDGFYSPDESHESRFYCDFDPSILGFKEDLGNENVSYRVGMVFNKGQESVDYFIDRIKDGNIEYDVHTELTANYRKAFKLAEESVRRWTIQNNEKDFPIVINYAFPEKTSDSYNDIRHSFNEVYKNEENKPVVTIYEEPRWSYQDKKEILNLIQKFDKDIYQEIEEFKERWELINDDLYIDLGKSIRYDDGDGRCGDWSEDVLKELESNYFTVRFSSEHHDGNLDNPFEMEVDSETAKKLNSMIEDHVKSNQEKFIEFKNKRNDLISKELSSHSMNLDAVDELTLKEISKQGFHVLTKKNPENELVRLQRPQLTVELEKLLNLSKTGWYKGKEIEDVNYGFYREFEIGKNGNVVNKSEIKVWKDFVDANEKTVDLEGTNDPMDFFVKSEDAKRMVNDFFEKGINDYIRERNPEVAFRQDLKKDILDNCVLGHSVEEHNEVGAKVEKNTFTYRMNDEIAKKLGLDQVSAENPDIKYHYEVRASYLTQNGTSKLRFDKTEFDFVSLATDYSNDKVHGEALDDKTVIFPLSDYAASMGEDTVSLIKNRIEDKAAELTDSKEILALERGEEVHFSVEELEPAQVDNILLFYAKESKNDRTLSVDLANEIIRITDEQDSSLFVDPAGRICTHNYEGGILVYSPEELYKAVQMFFTNELEGGSGTMSFLEQEEIDKYMKEFDDFYDKEMTEHSYSYLFPEHFFKHISELDDYNLTYKGTYLFPQDGECQIVEGTKAELEKIADDYGYELHPDFVYRTDDLSTDYATEVPDLSKSAFELNWSGFTEEHFNSLKKELSLSPEKRQNDNVCKGFIKIGSVEIELNCFDAKDVENPEIEYNIDVMGEADRSDRCGNADVPYRRFFKGERSFSPRLILENSYESFKKKIERILEADLQRPELRKEAERPFVDWSDVPQVQELYRTKMFEKLSFNTDRTTSDENTIYQSRPLKFEKDGDIIRSDYAANDIYVLTGIDLLKKSDLWQKALDLKEKNGKGSPTGYVDITILKRVYKDGSVPENEFELMIENDSTEENFKFTVSQQVLENINSMGKSFEYRNEDIERKEEIQGKAAGISELESLKDSIENLKKDISTEKENAESLDGKEEELKGFALHEFAETVKEYDKFFENDTYIKLDDLNYEKPPYKDFELYIGKNSLGHLVLSFTDSNSITGEKSEHHDFYFLNKQEFGSSRVIGTQFLYEEMKDVFELSQNLLFKHDYLIDIQNRLKDILKSEQAQNSAELEELIKDNQSRKDNIADKASEIKTWNPKANILSEIIFDDDPDYSEKTGSINLYVMVTDSLAKEILGKKYNSQNPDSNLNFYLSVDKDKKITLDYSYYDLEDNQKYKSGSLEVVGKNKEKIFKLMDDYYRDNSDSGMSMTDDFNSVYAAPSKEPKDLIKEYAEQAEREEKTSGFNVSSAFKAELLDGLKTNKNPLIVTRDIVNKWYAEGKEKGDSLNSYLKSEGCTSKEGFEKFFKDTIGLSKKVTVTKEKNKQKEKDVPEIDR